MPKRLNAGEIYDAFPEGQTMTREAFVKECGDLMCPHRRIQDLTRMTMECHKQRTLGLYSKNRIDRAVKGD